MSEIQFNAGDVVLLKSGGPTMTVDWAEAEEGTMTCCCSWFDEKNKPMQRKFRAATLKKAED